MARNATNQLLHKAQKSKCDEFYTQLPDIERELQHYPDCFREKVVYCNCDNPYTSNFFHYFVKNFKELGLKKIIAACYVDCDNDLFSGDQTEKNGFFCEYSGETDEYGKPEIPECIFFRGDGDFRSDESIELLKRSDIVVTNPPFSLFREFIAQIIKYGKQFLVIGTVNAITYKEIFDLIQKNKIWLGVNMGRGISGFIVPEHYELYGSEVHIDDEGKRIIATNNCLWLTNLELPQRHDDIALTKKYSGCEEKYLRFDNCNGINIDRTQDIPKDYCGLMGVPITFLHKYNPEQFEIVRFRKGDDGKDLCVNGKCPYFRILIRNKRLETVENL